MTKNNKTKFWITLCSLAIFFVSFNTASSETASHDSKSLGILKAPPIQEASIKIRLVENEAQSPILSSSLPCDWEWWMFGLFDCEVSQEEGEEEKHNDGTASSDSTCLNNCDTGSIKSYRKLCVSRGLGENGQELEPTIWFSHGCTNCSAPEEDEDQDEDGTSSSSISFGLSHPLFVGSFSRLNSLGWLNGNTQSLRLFNPTSATRAKPAAQVIGNILSTVYRFADTKKVFVNLDEARDSQRAPVHQLGDSGKYSSIVILSTSLTSEKNTPTTLER